ncbi:MAG: ATP-binding cassette domain-containing protein [Rhodobacteraceae bacterium]|nr:ATP-binding cassette domain-containing protein [Paracoccaceae bacterium]
MRSFWGLLTAFWRSQNRTEAWTLAILIAGLSWFVSKVGIWIAEAAGAFENAKATYQTPGNLDPLGRFETAALALVAMVTLSVLTVATRHYFSQTLQRKWRAWLNAQFTEATLGEGHTILKIQSNPTLDSLDQRQQECLKTLTGNAIGLAMGVLTVLTSAWEVSRKLWQISTPVSQLPALGTDASFVLTLGVIVPFAVLCTWGFARIGNVMRGVNKTFMEAEGAFRSELNTMFRRAGQITATAGERVQKKVNRTLYADIDHVWHRNNVLQAGFMGLHDFYTMVSFQVVASVLALPAYAQGAIDFQTYITTAALVGQLTNGFSWLIDVTPALAALKADVERVNEYAQEVEKVQDTRAYFQATGIHDFTYRLHPPSQGIRVRGLELMHEGLTAQPFLRAPADLHFPAGTWTALVGTSGGGKTSFLNALMGQEDYGRAEVFLPPGRKPFYAAQAMRIPDTTLKQLVAGPEDEEDFADTDIAAVLAETGLGFPEFLRCLHEKNCHGRPWDRALSGGQKKRLILAQLLLLRPEVALLDEVTAGLDPGAQTEFYDVLKRHCPTTTVISSIHNRAMPFHASGAPVYQFVAEIDDGLISVRRFHAGARLHLSPSATETTTLTTLTRHPEHAPHDDPA